MTTAMVPSELAGLEMSEKNSLAGNDLLKNDRVKLEVVSNIHKSSAVIEM